MRVGVQHGKKMFKLDHGPYENIEKLSDMEEYLELICQVNESNLANQDVRQPRITIAWQDSEQREFRMTVRDVWALRNILLEFPFLKHSFDYLPRKK